MSLNEFPPSTHEDWRRLVDQDPATQPFEKKLVTQTEEGISLQPLYTDYSSPSVAPARPRTPSSNWAVSFECANASLAEAAVEIVEGLAGGATAISLQAGPAGIPIASLGDLEKVLGTTKLDSIPVSLSAGPQFLSAATALTALWKKRGVRNPIGDLGIDPLGAWAETGEPCSASAWADLGRVAQATAKSLPRVTTALASTRVYHEAGAQEAQDLGIAMATAVDYLRAMLRAHMSVDDSCRQIAFSFSMDADIFMSIAKLRAARMLWSRIASESGASASAQSMARLLAFTSARMMSIRDPWVNLLRVTAATFAAGVAGADQICVMPYDSTFASPTEFSRRIARNTQLILREEASLGSVVDPAAGSWFVESLTEQLAEAGWKFFQLIEAQGGMKTAISSGWLLGEIEKTLSSRIAKIRTRKKPLTGVSEFPNLQESLTGFPPLRPKSLSPLFPPHRFDESFEALRATSDAILATTKKRPQIFLTNMGTIPQHGARAQFSANFFEAGGIEALQNSGFMTPQEAAAAFKKTGAHWAVICSSDQLYPDIVPTLAPLLKASGARHVLLAGRPGENETSWRAAGVDGFIYTGCDVWKTCFELFGSLHA